MTWDNAQHLIGLIRDNWTDMTQEDYKKIKDIIENTKSRKSKRNNEIIVEKCW